jgi:long-chain acyl-CoA synthetase
MKLNQDLALVKPTIFASVPRLYQRLYQTIKEKLDKLEGYKKTMADYAYNTKKYYLQNGGHVTHSIPYSLIIGLWDKMVFSKTKEAFGGRVRYMITASAPISGEILDFIKIVACCPVLEGYGQTESTGGSFLTHPSDPLSDHVGGPLSHTEFKLVDVPEMKYTSTDVDEQGRPQPRGEICFRGPSLFKGYYKEHEKTKEALDDEGWLHSGDVGVLLPNGSVKIVDRKKNIFKLSQGEYIAPEKLENIYMKVKGVQEAFVYGDSL